MFSGSLKFNLDPWEVVTDERLREILDLLGLDLDIQTIITEGGSNLSLGEKQLLCLGRAILRYIGCRCLSFSLRYLDIYIISKKIYCI